MDSGGKLKCEIECEIVITCAKVIHSAVALRLMLTLDCFPHRTANRALHILAAVVVGQHVPRANAVRRAASHVLALGNVGPNLTSLQDRLASGLSG